MSGSTESPKFGPEFPFSLARDPDAAEKFDRDSTRTLTALTLGLSSTQLRDPLPHQDIRRSFSPREGPDDTTGDGSQQQHSPPLGVELTCHRLFMTSVILGLGIPMVAYSYNGQTLFSTRLDWVVRIVCTILYVFFLFPSVVQSRRLRLMAVLMLSFLGLIKANRPELAPRFFLTDLAPSILGILKCLSRSECGCLANQQKGTDCVL